jgi:hypothetical protein
MARSCPLQDLACRDRVRYRVWTCLSGRFIRSLRPAELFDLAKSRRCVACGQVPPLNQPHPAQVTPSWYGDSVGHHEGDTLVIDTVGIKVGRYSMVDWYGTPHTGALHVVERYRLLDSAAAKEGFERDANIAGAVRSARPIDQRRGTRWQRLESGKRMQPDPREIRDGWGGLLAAAGRPKRGRPCLPEGGRHNRCRKPRKPERNSANANPLLSSFRRVPLEVSALK